MDLIKRFGKVLLPIVTPFDKNEEVDYGVFEQLIEYLIEHDQCDTLIITGTTGEASLLTFEERVKLYETAVKVVNGRRPLIAGTGCVSTKETIALTNKAYELGIDTAMVVAPFYNKPTQEGVYLHYEKLAHATKANILLYNIPIFVGINIDPETVRRLAVIPNVVGIKDEAGINPTQVSDYFLATKDIRPDFIVYNGDDIMLLPTVIQGAHGIISGGAHVFGKEIRKVFTLFDEGKNQEAQELFLMIYRYARSLGQNGRILPNSLMRPAIELVTKVPVGPARSPLAPATEEELEVVKGILKEAGKL